MLTTQGWILAICNIIIFVVVIVGMVAVKKDSEDGNKPLALVKNVVALVFFFIVMALQVYSLNCMVTGDCHLWAWILAVFAVITTLLYMGAFVIILFGPSKKDASSLSKA